MSRHRPEETFQAFWDRYPKHVAKKLALKAWCKLDPDEALIDTILDALAWQRVQAQWLKNDGAFIPHATTWLHGERWLDERPRTTSAPPVLTRFAALGTHRVLK